MVDATQPPLRGRPNLYGLSTFLLAPLHVAEQFVGVLFLDHGGAVHTYTADDQALAGVAAKLAALVIERERLLHEQADARASQLALREAHQRMDEFLDIASHELKTPLTSLMGFVQLAERRLQKVTAEADMAARDDLRTVLVTIQDLLARTARQLGRIDGLVNDLLDSSRVNAGQLVLRPARCNLVTITRVALEEQRAVWPERPISLILGDEDEIQVMADGERITQVLTNYLTNALKYSPADAGVTLTLRREGEEVRVSVRDEGPGIPLASQAHLWERFYRVEGVETQSGSGLGLGLGLHICRSIIERHQGHVGVESAPGKGSTFWFALPLAGPG